MKYNPRAPTYGPDWFTSRDVGTQCCLDNAPCKYVKAIRKHADNAKRLKTIAKLVMEDETLTWYRMKQSGLWKLLKKINN